MNSSPQEIARLVEELRAASGVLRDADQKQYQNTIPTKPGPSILLRHATLMTEAADALTRRVEGEDAQPYKDALHDLVMLRAQQDIGCVPAPTKEQWAKAWAEAEELTRVEQ